MIKNLKKKFSELRIPKKEHTAPNTASTESEQCLRKVTTHQIGVVIFDKSGDSKRYLLLGQQRPEGNKMSWEIPSGARCADEWMISGADRIASQVGYDVEVCGICYIVDYLKSENPYVMLIFGARLIIADVEPKSTEGLNGITRQWFTLEEVENLKATGQLCGRSGEAILRAIRRCEHGDIISSANLIMERA